MNSLSKERERMVEEQRFEKDKDSDMAMKGLDLLALFEEEKNEVEAANEHEDSLKGRMRKLKTLQDKMYQKN